MKFCEECGAQLEENALFCENCGARCGAGQSPDAAGTAKQDKRKSAVLPAVIIGIAVLALVGAVLFMLLRDREQRTLSAGATERKEASEAVAAEPAEAAGTEREEASEAAGAEVTEAVGTEREETSEVAAAEPAEAAEAEREEVSETDEPDEIETQEDEQGQGKTDEPDENTDAGAGNTEAGQASGIPDGIRADDWLEIYEIAGEYIGEFREQYCQLSIFSDGLGDADGAGGCPEVGVANIGVWDYEKEEQYWFENLSVRLAGKNVYMTETDEGDVIYFGIYFDPYSDLEGCCMDLYFNGESQGEWLMIAHYYS